MCVCNPLNEKSYCHLCGGQRADGKSWDTDNYKSTSKIVNNGCMCLKLHQSKDSNAKLEKENEKLKKERDIAYNHLGWDTSK